MDSRLSLSTKRQFRWLLDGLSIYANKAFHELTSPEIFSFIKGFNAQNLKEKHQYQYSLRFSIEKLVDKFKLPLTDYYLTESQIISIFNHKR